MFNKFHYTDQNILNSYKVASLLQINPMMGKFKSLFSKKLFSFSGGEINLEFCSENFLIFGLFSMFIEQGQVCSKVAGLKQRKQTL